MLKRLAKNLQKAPSQTDRAECEKHDALLVRVLGNDLPPRHKCGQTLANLEFILQHERTCPEVAKHWVVNRIWDCRMENEILRVLDSLGQSYLHIPFDLRRYAQEPFDYKALPSASSTGFRRMSRPQRLRADLHARRHRSNYAINNNGARRAALDYGRDKAKWVLPWDGNSFLTENAWQEIKKAIRDNDNRPYLMVPMARVKDNRQLLDDTFHPKATEEPQIIFRCDALETFDPGRPYGRRPKVELLWRLGVPGPWDQFEDDPWDLPRPALSREAGEFAWAGWVARLESGHRHLEKPTRWSGWLRGQTRTTSIAAALDKLDAEAVAMSLPKGPLFLEQTLLAAGAKAWADGGGPFHEPAASVIADAVQASKSSHESLWRSTINLTLAWQITGQESDARAAAAACRARLVRGKPLVSSAEEFALFLDSVQLLHRSSFLGGAELAVFQRRLTGCLNRWTRGWWGLRRSRRTDSGALLHDLRSAVTAAYLCRYHDLAVIIRRFHGRLAWRFSSGQVPLPLRTNELSAWLLITLLSERAGMGGVHGAETLMPNGMTASAPDSSTPNQAFWFFTSLRSAANPAG